MTRTPSVDQLWKGKTAVILLSGGLDSSVNAYWAASLGISGVALTIDYGQRARNAEIRTAKKLSQNLNFSHQVVSLPFLAEWSQSSLTHAEKRPPQGSEVSIDDLSVSEKTAAQVWVSNRNGVFISVAAALAESLQLDGVLVGFNKEEAATFPDNTPEFIDASNSALRFSTGNQTKVFCFTADLDKTEIVAHAKKLNVPLDVLWPCYFDGERPCGTCESCQRFHRAMGRAAGPTLSGRPAEPSNGGKA